LLWLLKVRLPLCMHVWSSRALLLRLRRRVPPVAMRKFASADVTFSSIAESKANSSLEGRRLVVLRPRTRRRSLLPLKVRLLLLLPVGLLPAGIGCALGGCAKVHVHSFMQSLYHPY
jgi:hypothetical protein